MDPALHFQRRRRPLRAGMLRTCVFEWGPIGDPSRMISNRNPSVILLDIEGTTTPVSFVYNTLFPYARTHMKEFLIESAQRDDLRRDIEMLEIENRTETSPSAPRISAGAEFEQACKYLIWLMDQDIKSPALKSIQGKIWEAGYANGQLKSIVFDDVPSAFGRWRHNGRHIAIYSSGSVLAQQLLFRHTQAGNLAQWISAYFDTAVGPKSDPASYSKIAFELKANPGEILFLSDAPAELDAALIAGMNVCMAKRPGNRELPQQAYLTISNFDEL
jgi:enolase-phosphatase E1